MEDPIQSYHFVGICGVAMAQVAAWLKSSGKGVTGSDQGVYPPMSDFLKAQGIDVRTPYDAANLSGADAVVIGNALSRGNPEVEATLEKRLPFLSLPELIHDEILADKLPVVVTGTHGKTTTTAALAHLLKSGNLYGGCLAGGLPVGWTSGFEVAAGRWFAIEGDEYDTAFFDKRPKFLHYQPQVVIVNNIEFDHADIYASLDEILLQFRRLIRLVPGNGCLIVNADQPVIEPLLEEAHCPIVRFGLKNPADARGELIEISPDGMKFAIYFDEKYTLNCRTSLWGEHQLYNLAAAAAAAQFAGVSDEDIVTAMESFKGVKRRLELKYSDGRRWIYDDFAHHPTAVKDAIRSLRARHPGLPIYAAFEPRSNTMVRKKLQGELTEALALADGVAIGKIHRANKIDAADRLDLEQIVAYIRQKGIGGFHHAGVSSLIDWLRDTIADEAVVVVMSNGSFDGLVDRLVEAISREK